MTTTRNAIPAGLYARILTSTTDTGSVFVFNSGHEVDNFTVPAVYANDLAEIEVGAKMHGWKFIGAPEPTNPGQMFVPVERIPADR